MEPTHTKPHSKIEMVQRQAAAFVKLLYERQASVFSILQHFLTAQPERKKSINESHNAP